ncbi:dihydropteroate synthase [Desulfovibrio litoralis]|nr:dihydropteroate synthase [Desulfovibrio litoralis]
MGIVNVTPDSFSDGGSYFELDKAKEHVLELCEQNVDILDIGAESTRPFATPVSVDDEIERLKPLLSFIQAQRQDPESVLKDIPVSIDTFKAKTAEFVIACDAEIINDVSGGVFDSEMKNVLAEQKPAYILGHSPKKPQEMQKRPSYQNVVEEILSFFETQMNLLVQAGLPETHIALDPCFGFGKNLEHNIAIFKAIPRFMSLKRPLVVGLSRKAMLRQLLAHESLHKETMDKATQIALSLIFERCVGDGVIIHRVHNVLGAAQAFQLSSQL